MVSKLYQETLYIVAKGTTLLSLNNVHEPRNAEITAFLGSFLPGDNQMTIILKIVWMD